jgi:hypothetical protein
MDVNAGLLWSRVDIFHWKSAGQVLAHLGCFNHRKRMNMGDIGLWGPLKPTGHPNLSHFQETTVASYVQILKACGLVLAGRPAESQGLRDVHDRSRLQLCAVLWFEKGWMGGIYTFFWNLGLLLLL